MNKPKIILIILVISLIANVALAVAYSRAPASAGASADRAVSYSSARNQLYAVLRNIPAEKRKAINAQMEAEFKQLTAISREAGKQRLAARRLLAEPQVDAKAVGERLNAVTALHKQMDDQANTMLVKILASMSPQERKAALTKTVRTAKKSEKRTTGAAQPAR